MRQNDTVHEVADEDQKKDPNSEEGVQRKTRHTGGAEVKTHTSDHGNHHKSCQRHNDTRNHLPGEGKHEWLATTHLPSINNSFDSIGW